MFVMFCSLLFGVWVYIYICIYTSIHRWHLSSFIAGLKAGCYARRPSAGFKLADGLRATLRATCSQQAAGNMLAASCGQYARGGAAVNLSSSMRGKCSPFCFMQDGMPALFVSHHFDRQVQDGMLAIFLIFLPSSAGRTARQFVLIIFTVKCRVNSVIFCAYLLIYLS